MSCKTEGMDFPDRAEPLLTPAAMPRRIVALAFTDVQILDITGPLEVFALATWLLAKQGAGDTGYAIELVADEAGPVTSSGGLQLNVQHTWRGFRGSPDTLLVPGGLGTEAAARDSALIRWLANTSQHARRVASVCTGALLLAEAGLLDGRRAATHWACARQLAQSYPKVQVDPDAIFVRDRNVYTSAGVTAGMDLALALVEEDLGRELALTVARHLVLFLKRPGGQSQFSVQLASQTTKHEPLRELQAWALAHLAADLSVEALARRVYMSPRNFARVFRREVGASPAKFVEGARLEEAQRRLVDTHGNIERIATECGFGTAETMRRVFLRWLRVTPSEYRDRFQSAIRGQEVRQSRPASHQTGVETWQ